MVFNGTEPLNQCTVQIVMWNLWRAYFILEWLVLHDQSLENPTIESAGWRAKEWSAQKAESPRAKQTSDTTPVLCYRTTSFLENHWCEFKLKNQTIWSPMCVVNVNTVTEGGRRWWSPGSIPTSTSCSILVTSLLVNATNILCGSFPWVFCSTCKSSVAASI